MSSWFSSSTAFTSNLTDLKNKVQSSVNTLADNIDLQKLTLTSPELAAERNRIDNEEQHKERVKDSLAEILPWQTREEELEILVDECKEVILGLSGMEETFRGPFVLVGGLGGELDGDNDAAAAAAGGEDDDDDDDEDDENGQGNKNTAAKAAKDLEAAQLSSEKLSKLQPLPILLAEFDLDTHVGLIQRLLQIDPKLVEMHSRLSSGGEKEVTFWKNYFFHCAYARYEAGLSIDEIWSSERPIRRAVPATAGTDAGVANNNTSNEEEDYNIVDSVVGDRSQSEEEVLFESGSSSTESSSNDIKTASAAAAAEEKLFTPSAPAATPIKQIVQPSPTSEPNSVTHRTNTADSYEFISDNGGDDDGSMDELEAEIAAALGD